MFNATLQISYLAQLTFNSTLGRDDHDLVVTQISALYSLRILVSVVSLKNISQINLARLFVLLAFMLSLSIDVFER